VRRVVCVHYSVQHTAGECSVDCWRYSDWWVSDTQPVCWWWAQCMYVRHEPCRCSMPCPGCTTWTRNYWSCQVWCSQSAWERETSQTYVTTDGVLLADLILNEQWLPRMVTQAVLSYRGALSTRRRVLCWSHLATARTCHYCSDGRPEANHLASLTQMDQLLVDWATTGVCIVLQLVPVSIVAVFTESSPVFSDEWSVHGYLLVSHSPRRCYRALLCKVQNVLRGKSLVLEQSLLIHPNTVL